MFCSNCGSSLLEAKFCPNCGSPQKVSEPAPIDSVQLPLDLAPPSKGVNRKILIPVVAVAGAVVVFGGLAISGVFINPDIKQCQELVLDNLKFRETADFRDTTVTYSSSEVDGKRSISVNGEVVASNGFGVPVTADFWCTNFNTSELELEYLD